MKYICNHTQTRRRVLLKEDEAFELDKRIWELKPYTRSEFELISFIVDDDFFLCFPIEILP